MLHSVDESEICMHLAHQLQPDSRHGWGPKFQNSHLKTLREYGGYSMGLVSLNSQNVHGMNEMNKNEHFPENAQNDPKFLGIGLN